MFPSLCSGLNLEIWIREYQNWYDLNLWNFTLYFRLYPVLRPVNNKDRVNCKCKEHFYLASNDHNSIKLVLGIGVL
jgi:hypothetical protein